MDDGFTGTEMGMSKWLGSNTMLIVLGLIILLIIVFILYKHYTGMFG